MPSEITVRLQKDGWDIASAISVPLREEWTYEESKRNIRERVVSELNRYAIDQVLSHFDIKPFEHRTDDTDTTVNGSVAS